MSGKRLSRKCNSFIILAILIWVPKDPSIFIYYSVLPQELSPAHQGNACIRAKWPRRAACFLCVFRVSRTNLRYPQRAHPRSKRPHEFT